MGTYSIRRCGLGRILAGVALAALPAGCDYGPARPAPIVYATNPATPDWRSAPSYGAPGEVPRAMAAAPLRPAPMREPRPLGGVTPTPLHGVSPVEASREQAQAVVPLDSPTPLQQGPAAAERPAPPPAGPPGTLTPPAAALRPPSGEPSVAEEAREDAAPPAAGGAPPVTHGGRFPWPVRGPIVAAYGSTAGGGRNDGINIAAPRGTPIRAIEGGEVAYAGNELRGYGNLVLIKHDDGWISAYAHCEELLVRKGDKIAPGQVIAKVGSTGGVTTPQLHFELRRGKQSVDPRQYLAPASSAGSSAAERG